MRILTCIKFVPDPAGDVSFDADRRIVRDDAGIASELDEYAVEQALRLRDALPDATVTALTIGPTCAEGALRKALQMGATEAVLVSDPAVAGSDVFATASAIAAAAATLGDIGAVVCGMSSPDAEMGVLPALVARELGWPLLSLAAEVTASGDVVQIVRHDEHGRCEARATLPAVVSVTDQSGEPRYPTFKDVLAAKRRSIVTWTLADLGVAEASLGTAAARVELLSIDRNPERARGRTIVDDAGSSVDEVVAFLAAATN